MTLISIWDEVVYLGVCIFCQILCPLKLWLKPVPLKWLIEVKYLSGFLRKDLEAASVQHLLGEKQQTSLQMCGLMPPVPLF